MVFELQMHVSESDANTWNSPFFYYLSSSFYPSCMYFHSIHLNVTIVKRQTTLTDPYFSTLKIKLSILKWN